MAAVSHATSACLLFLLCCLYTVCDAAGTALLQNLSCSTAGNYTPSDAYASNLNQLLAAIPTTKHGGFIQATVGQGGAPGTAYGLALCFADFSLSDCLDCLATASDSAGGLVKQCSGSTTVVATYDRCLVHYSDAAFFGTAYTDVVYSSVLPGPVANQVYRRNSPWIGSMNALAASRATRFGYVFPIGGATNMAYILVQCTRDLATDKCKACLDMLGSRILRSQAAVFKTPSCWLRYSSSVTFPVFPPSDAVGEYASNFTTPSTDDAASNSTMPSTDASNSTTPSTDASNDSTMASTDASTSTASKNDRGSHRSRRRLSTGATVGTVVGVTVGVPSLAVLLVHYLRKRGSRRSSLHNRLEDMRSPEMTPGEGTKQTTESTVQEATQALNLIPVHTGRQFSYQQLLDATDKFSRVLGKGYFGEVYEGVLDDEGVAVKRILQVDEQAQRNYANEISNISELSHPNLVPLVGWCDENDELLLVYELIPNGSLDQHLYEKEAPLQWDLRYKVAIGIAKALDHLHGQNCIHRDIKPSNVMLDEHFNAKVGDFGLVRRIIRPGNTSGTMTTITRDFGYIDPESIRTGRASKASDIYSFGVLLLEIACGMRPTCRQEDPNVNTLIHKARMSYARGALLDTVDERLNSNFITAQVKLVILVGLICVQDNSTRPNCRQVLNFLSGRVPPPSPRKDQDSLAIQVDDAPDPKEYSYDRLSVATNRFAKIIGSGGFANVYEGKLDQISVAVKQMFRVDNISIKEFLSEIQVIRQLRHRNLLPLVGWYANKTKLLVVYKLMPKGSLHGHLHQKPNTLQWSQRFNIITGIASAVAYLHEGSNLQTVLHRDIKPSNVMLDENYTAKLGDFGLVREIDDDDVSKKTATFGGTIHYMDPEYFRTLQASKQTDVYSFGVVALEMVLGQSPKAFATEEGHLTNAFVQKTLLLYKDGRILDHVDKRLNGNFDKDQMWRVIEAGVRCVNPDRKKRPSCMQVKHYLEGHASEFEPSPSSSMIPQEFLQVDI